MNIEETVTIRELGLIQVALAKTGHFNGKPIHYSANSYRVRYTVNDISTFQQIRRLQHLHEKPTKDTKTLISRLKAIMTWN